MSVHLVTSALKTPLKGAHKLVFLGLCESACDDAERLSWPGLEALVEAGSVSRARVFAILKDLLEQGWIVQTGRGKKHRRAEYRVFPGGCCKHHSAIPWTGEGKRKKVSYSLFIVSAEWRQIRVRFWAKQGRFCAACGSTENLHVHHKTYERLGGNELLTDLVGLCASCHGDVHDLHRAEGGSLQALTEELVAARSTSGRR